MQKPSLKSRILDHAETRLLEQGYRGMRVDELARDVGISKRTLYEHFRTKEEMAREALSRLVDNLQDSCDQAIAKHDDEAVQLREVVLLICQRFSRARDAFYRDLDTTPTLDELIQRSRKLSYEKIDTVIRAGIEAGRFRPELEPRIVRMTFLAACDSIIKPRILIEDRLSLEHAYRGILDVILNGVLVGPPAPPAGPPPKAEPKPAPS